MEHDRRPANAEAPHDEDADAEAQLDLNDVEEVMDDEGDAPMDEEDDEEVPPSSTATANTPAHASRPPQDGQDADEQEEFQDTSLAAFYSHRKSLFSVALHPSFPRPPLALTGGEDDGGWIWDTREGEEVVRLGGHTDSVTAVGFNAAGDMAATGGMDGRVRVWRRRQGANKDDWSVWEFFNNLEGPDEVVWLQWHPKGNALLVGASDSTMWMWMLPKGDLMHCFTGHTDAVTSGDFTPDGRRIVSASEDGSLIVWDPRTADVLAKLQPSDLRLGGMGEGGITSMTISSDSKLVALGGASGEVRVVSIANVSAGGDGLSTAGTDAGGSGGKASVVASLSGHEPGESVEAVEFLDLISAASGGANSAVSASRPPTHLLTASTDGTALVWDLATRKVRNRASHAAALTSLQLHRSAAGGPTPFYTTASADHTMRTWDARTGERVAEHRGFTDGVLALAVGRDDGYTQGAATGGVGSTEAARGGRGWKLVGAGDEGVALVFRF